MIFLLTRNFCSDSLPSFYWNACLHYRCIVGVYGWYCVRQVYETNHEGRDHSVQQERPDHPAERVPLPRLQDRRSQVHGTRMLCYNINPPPLSV